MPYRAEMVSGSRFRRNRGKIIGFGLRIALLSARTAWAFPMQAMMWVPRVRGRLHNRRVALALLLAGATALGGCGNFGMTETLQRGYVLPEGSLEQIPIGASQEQVLIGLGTPSTVAPVNGEAFYYISQKAQRSAAFMPYEVTDQRVIAVYFDKERRGTRLAQYWGKDGEDFGFFSPTRH